MYMLNIQFSPPDLNMIMASGQSVAVLRRVEAPGSVSVAWAVFRPMMTNQVAWEGGFDLFASRVRPVNGAILTFDAQTNATDSALVPYRNGGFGPPQGAAPRGAYGVLNITNQSVSFGLAASVQVNGSLTRNAITAAEVAANSQILFNPQDTIQLCLLQGVTAGAVVTNLPYSVSELNFSPVRTTQTVRFQGGRFVPV